MIDLHRESATDPRTAHRISEIDRALSLIRGVVASQHRFLDGHAQSDLSTVAGILLVEREHLQRTTPQSADPATEDLHANCQECGIILESTQSKMIGLCIKCREDLVNN